MQQPAHVCHAATIICGIAICSAPGFIVCHTATVIHSIVFGHAAMLIGSVIFDLTTMETRDVLVCCVTLAKAFLPKLEIQHNKKRKRSMLTLT